MNRKCCWDVQYKLFSRLEEPYDCQQTLDNFVPMWGPVLWQLILIQQQCLPEEPRGFSVWVQWKMWFDFIPNLNRSLSPSRYRDLRLLQNQTSAWGLPLSAYGGFSSCCCKPSWSATFVWKGPNRFNLEFLPVDPGYYPNFQSSQAEAVIKPWRSVEGALGHLFTPLKHKRFLIYRNNRERPATLKCPSSIVFLDSRNANVCLIIVKWKYIKHFWRKLECCWHLFFWFFPGLAPLY